MNDTSPQSDLVAITADVVSAYVANNKATPDQLVQLIASTHAALSGLGASVDQEPVASEAKSKSDIRKSLRGDAIISFIDGRPYKSIKRHLSANGMTPDEYRTRFGLPADYPMVAPEYSAKRSALAKQLGLGQKGSAAKRGNRPRKAKAPASA